MGIFLVAFTQFLNDVDSSNSSYSNSSKLQIPSNGEENSSGVKSNEPSPATEKEDSGNSGAFQKSFGLQLFEKGPDNVDDDQQNATAGE